MKKLILTAAAALVFAASASAQLGVVAGVTSAATDLESAYADIAKAQTVTQYHAGIVYNLNLPLGLSVQPGIIYNMKGQALSQQIAGQKVDINCSTGYLEVPVRLALGMDLGVVKPMLFVEPYAGYAITTEAKTEFENATAQSIVSAAIGLTGLPLDTANDEKKWDGRNRLEYGVGVGAAVVVLKRVGVSAKYYWDLGSAYTEDGQASYSAQAMYDATKEKKCSGIVASLTLYF